MSTLLAVDLLPSFLANHDVATLLAVCPGVLRSGLIVNANGRSVRSAVIEVSTPGDAQRIIQTMDGVEIAGTAIRVSRLEGPPQEGGGEHEAEPSQPRQRGLPAERQSMGKPSSSGCQGHVAPGTAHMLHVHYERSTSHVLHPLMANESDEAGRKIRSEVTRQPCAHQRAVDEFRDEQGRPTGKLICVECRTVFPDPDKSQQQIANSE